MFKNKMSFLLPAAATLLLGMTAKADTYTFTVDNCSGNCAPNSTDTVTVVQDGANTVKITVSLSNLGYVSTGAGAPSGGTDGSFFFNIKAISGGNVDNPTISISNLTE